jgi:glycosyltransferase involved in cell wall biosynthesis
VYNGERYVADALNSVLGQTYRDLEVVVCDNASTDATRRICEGFVARDPRVRYHRNERNLGASPNWNRTFDLSRGELFKWAAHDDVLCPTFLERAVAALDAEPDAVLCQSLILYIDQAGRRLGLYDSGLGDAAASRCSTRFATLALRSHTCTELYGLIRRSALSGSMMHGNYHGGDRALLAQLALRGRFIQVREPLLLIRDHQSRYTRTIVRPRERSTWHDAGKTGRLLLPTLQLYRDYLRSVEQDVEEPLERLRCYGQLARWWLHNWNWARVATDALAVLAPGTLVHADRVKQALFGAPPGHFLKTAPAVVEGPDVDDDEDLSLAHH